MKKSQLYPYSSICTGSNLKCDFYLGNMDLGLLLTLILYDVALLGAETRSGVTVLWFYLSWWMCRCPARIQLLRSVTSCQCAAMTGSFTHLCRINPNRSDNAFCPPNSMSYIQINEMVLDMRIITAASLTFVIFYLLSYGFLATINSLMFYIVSLF